MAGYRQSFTGNATSVKLIKQEWVRVTTFSDAGGRLSTLRVELTAFPAELPKDAVIKVQIIDNQSEKTVDMGTVGMPKLLESVDVADFEGPRYRVFIRNVNDPKLIAKSKWETTRSTSSTDEPSVGILPLEPSDLGEVLWRLQLLPDDVPVILFNNRDDYDVKAQLTGNSVVLAFVITEVLRQILLHLHEHQDAANSWVADWTSWALSHGLEIPDQDEEEEDVIKWAYEAVSRFARDRALLSSLVKEE